MVDGAVFTFTVGINLQNLVDAAIGARAVLTVVYGEIGIVLVSTRRVVDTHDVFGPGG